MERSILFLIAGLFAIICTLKKPAFYWESRKARRMRGFIGDTGTTIFYLIIGTFLTGAGIINLFQ
ncbi:hypothetical protein [Anaeromicrobium sediminis]|uniref:Uncharacterized protein n=1 Tax=Anaeromicrobium sediminis TaxID=1478221 RepID=A0A267MNA1_9FIRM|nr:hypothetical protein [Anaeromicrobium sediminis]PAB60230.1 hypothetical protein CCE28_04850 [Anaeromicrobium sediminis]